MATLPGWLGPFLDGITRRSHLGKLNMESVLRVLFTVRGWNELSRLAPETITVPTGSRIRLDYTAGDLPVLSVRLQEMFGQTDTPVIAGGRVSVLIHLLSPAGRPLAVTQDLRSFWSNAYREVRKEMRGRYPRHVWPEDPLGAKPTRRTKRSTRRG
jgi:ATP-dependent helicase HrpB